jgi:hypothetical protein
MVMGFNYRKPAQTRRHNNTVAQPRVSVLTTASRYVMLLQIKFKNN